MAYPGMLNPVANYTTGPDTLRSILGSLGLTSGLQVCLDAGDITSYDGSSQTWTDTSGGGYSFYRGTTSSSQATDPTFNGVAGRLSTSEYFSYDGGDRFTLAQSAPSWQSGMHKAGGAFTIIQWVYVGNLTSLAPTDAGVGCGDNVSSSSTDDAIAFTNSSSTQNALSISVQNGSNSIIGNRSTLLLTNNAWQMAGVAVTIDTAAIRFAVNDTTETRTNAGSGGSPSSTNSHTPMVIGAVAADGYSSVSSGCRIIGHAVWTQALSAANFAAIYSATRSRLDL